jgi:hypothetical protein
MFTDLVGSSALADRLRDVEAQTLRRAHDRMLRQRARTLLAASIRTLASIPLKVSGTRYKGHARRGGLLAEADFR